LNDCYGSTDAAVQILKFNFSSEPAVVQRMFTNNKSYHPAWQCWSDLACISDSIPALRPIHDNLLVYNASVFSVIFI